MRFRLLVVTLSVIVPGLPVDAGRAAAHHSFAGAFDANHPMELTGTVTKVEWINPHALVHVAVKNPGAQIENWEVEIGAPSSLFRRGWTKTSVSPGTPVVVSGYRAKDPGMLRLNGVYVLLPDGRRLFAGEPGTGAPEGPLPTPKTRRGSLTDLGGAR